MREIKTIMIEKYCLNRLKYDFMGYKFAKIEDLSYHHLIVPRRFCKKLEIGRGLFDWNGAMLEETTSHPYLHLIERYNLDMFYAITSEMIDENIKGYLDFDNLKRINDILNCFEKEYCSKRSKKGNLIIKEEYTRRILKK